MSKEDYKLLMWKKLEYKDIYFEDLEFKEVQEIEKVIDVAFSLYIANQNKEDGITRRNINSKTIVRGNKGT